MTTLIINEDSNLMDKKVAYDAFISDLRDKRRALNENWIEVNIQYNNTKELICSIKTHNNYEIRPYPNEDFFKYNYGKESNYSGKKNPWNAVQNCSNTTWFLDPYNKLSIISIISESCRQELIRELMLKCLQENEVINMNNLVVFNKNYDHIISLFGGDKQMGDTISINELEEKIESMNPNVASATRGLLKDLDPQKYASL